MSAHGHKTPTAKSCHAGENESFEQVFPAPPFLTFFDLPLSACDKAITSPEHDLRVFRLSGWMITRFALRDSPSATSDREAVNLGDDMCFASMEGRTCT